MPSRFPAPLRLVFTLLVAWLGASILSASMVEPPPKEPKPPTLFPGPVVPVRSSADILNIMERVADWQLAWPDEREVTHWARATGYLGLSALVRVSPEQRFEAALLDLARQAEWKLGPRLYHADDHTIGQLYLELYARHRAPSMLDGLRATFDAILAAPVTGSLDRIHPWRHDRWTWCDALFMSPPAWAELSQVTGDSRYLDFALRDWVEADDYLYDKAERLYFRDSRFFTIPENNGAKTFWGRGNGWMLAAYARLLPHVPANRPERPALEARFRELAARVVELQPADGLWRSSMLDTVRHRDGDTSGSALFCYGLAWGINAGLLDHAAFAPATLRAWDALCAHVQRDGRLIHAQPVGHRPFRFDLDTAEVYASGSLLLAGEQILQLVTAPAARRLPSRNPKRGRYR